MRMKGLGKSSSLTPCHWEEKEEKEDREDEKPFSSISFLSPYLILATTTRSPAKLYCPGPTHTHTHTMLFFLHTSSSCAANVIITSTSSGGSSPSLLFFFSFLFSSSPPSEWWRLLLFLIRVSYQSRIVSAKENADPSMAKAWANVVISPDVLILS